MQVFDIVQIIKKNKGTFIGLFIAFLFVPFVPFLIFMVLTLAYYRKDYTYLSFTFLLIIVFSSLNFTRSIDADWENYLDFYKSFNGNNLIGFLTESQLSVRITEPLFYAYAWLLSNASNGNLYLYILSISCMIYGIYAIGIIKLIRIADLANSNLIFCMVCGFFVCINFSESSHLIRQYISGSILFFQLPYLVKKKYKSVFVITVIGTLVHNSFILPSLFMIFSALLATRLYFIKQWVRVFIISSFFGIMLGLFLSQYLIVLNAENFENETPVYFSMLIDSACFCFALLLYFSNNASSKIKQIISIYLAFMFMYSSFLFVVHDNQLIFQRFYLYLEWFRILGFIALSVLIPSLGKLNDLTLSACSICMLVIFLRIFRTEWSYGVGMTDFLLKNFIQLILNIGV
jgi:hypothetical protein